MALSHLPASVANAFFDLARWLDRRRAARLPVLLLGMLFASGRRTVTSWFRGAGITTAFRQSYVTVGVVGRAADSMAISTVLAVRPLFRSQRLADRNAEEQTFKDVKEVGGAGQQQVRNLYSNAGCFNLNLWMYSLVETWAWSQEEQELVDRAASPWDSEPRRPSHQDKRKALQREALQAEIEEALSGRPTKERIRQLAERRLDLAA